MAFCVVNESSTDTDSPIRATSRPAVQMRGWPMRRSASRNDGVGQMIPIRHRARSADFGLRQLSLEPSSAGASIGYSFAFFLKLLLLNVSDKPYQNMSAKEYAAFSRHTKPSMYHQLSPSVMVPVPDYPDAENVVAELPRQQYYYTANDRGESDSSSSGRGSVVKPR